MKVDRSDPFVWGGEVAQAQSSMGGREVADPSDRPTEFCRHQLWRENCEGLKRLGFDTTAYEAAGPTLFGLHDWEHPRRTRMVKLSNVIKHDAEPPHGHRRLCGTILAIR